MLYGRTYVEHLAPLPQAKWNENRDCWESAETDLISGLPDVWSETWPRSGMTRNGQLFEHQMLEPPIAGQEFSYLPTPTTQDGANNGGPSQLERNTPPLNALVTLLPTPTAVDGNTVAQSEWDKSNPKRRLKAIGSELENQTDFGQYTPAIERWEFLTDRPAPPPTQPSKTGKPQLSPNFVEWMMGLPDGWVTGVDVTRAQALKMLGNGVVPAQAAAALQQLLHIAKEAP